MTLQDIYRLTKYEETDLIIPLICRSHRHVPEIAPYSIDDRGNERISLRVYRKTSGISGYSMTGSVYYDQEPVMVFRHESNLSRLGPPYIVAERYITDGGRYREMVNYLLTLISSRPALVHDPTADLPALAGWRLVDLQSTPFASS